MWRWLACVGIAASAVLPSIAQAADTARKRPAPIGVGYSPVDADERGLWMRVDAIERAMKTSDFLIRDLALNTYVRGVLCRTVGEANCGSLRLYIVREASFNATMAPNGMVTVYTGALLRLRSEAQLAAILGHEYTHFTHRHTVQKNRDAKSKAKTAALLALVPVTNIGMAAAMIYLQRDLVGSMYRFSRETEAEADAGSIPLMVAAGYDPAVAVQIWERLRVEDEATAAARRKRVRKDEGGFFATHPSGVERIAALTALVARQARSGAARDDAAAYRAAMTPWLPLFLDDQIKLNDFGASDFLLGELASDGWTPPLLYARGELYRTRGRPADLTRAAGFYRRSLAGEAYPEAWRGLGLVALRAGDAAEGRQALKEYLARRPEATDRAMITMLAGEAP